MKNVFKLFLLLFLPLVGLFLVFAKDDFAQKDNTTSKITSAKTIKQNALKTPPSKKFLENDYHIFQSFNNCGPASLSMALSYYGIHKSQEELGEEIRPYQVASGDNDDKSVTLDELAENAEKYGFVTYHLPNGDIKKLKEFITYNIPVITRTWLHKDEDIGHYRLIVGYNDETQEIIQDDSFEGNDLTYSYSDFNEIWSKFGYEYLVLIPKDKTEIAKQIIGEDINKNVAWEKAIDNYNKELKNDPNNPYTIFNLSVAYYNVGNYKKSVEEFEKVENDLSFRTLWYQIEPIEAYYKLGNYDHVFQITDEILSNQNRAFSELYVLRGNSDLKLGNKDAAKQEFGNAVFYNKNLKEAQDALKSV